ncbi:MAG: hypothetical protein ACI89D_002629 [Bermanella sp.]|jgi:hypothetical protein
MSGKGSQQNLLLGAWSLVSWSIEFSDARPARYPYGESAWGSIVYSDNGRMLAAISRDDREALSVAVPQQAPDVEKIAAFDSFFSYGGSYSTEGDTVIHSVDIALNPNFVGSEQRRTILFEGDCLTLSAHEGARHHKLKWRRVA